MNVSFDEPEPSAYHKPASPAGFANISPLPFESPKDLYELTLNINDEYQPETPTEQRLVNSMIQSYWLKERAIQLQQELMFRTADAAAVDAKRLALFLRYQSVHERSYYKAMKELRAVQKERRREQIGFESQNRQEAHEARIRLTTARAQSLEVETACRKVMEVPLPNNETITFEELTQACSEAISSLAFQKRAKAAA